MSQWQSCMMIRISILGKEIALIKVSQGSINLDRWANLGIPKGNSLTLLLHRKSPRKWPSLRKVSAQGKPARKVKSSPLSQRLIWPERTSQASSMLCVASYQLTHCACKPKIKAGTGYKLMIAACYPEEVDKATSLVLNGIRS